MTQTDLLIIREDNEGVATLTLNNPKKLNALSAAMISALSNALDAIAADTRVRVVVITGSGKAFCAGHDLKEMIATPEPAPSAALFGACSTMMLKIANLPQPVIARVNGVAAAAGCQLVAQCDLAIASTDAKFATSGINLGLFCATPSVPLTRAVGNKAAAELLYSGRFIDGVEAQRIGLINRAVGPEILDAEVDNLAREIAAKSPEAIHLGKALLHAQQGQSLEDAYIMAARTMSDNLQTDDAREGIKAFVEKRTLPTWKDRTS